ncbi:MAG: 30S ribosomal protein S9 [Thermaerobacterales bacterium]
MAVQIQHRGTGRRKEAVARVRLFDGSGRVIVNNRALEDYFPLGTQRESILEPLRAVDAAQRVDVIAHVQGGGISGQAGALRHGIARALIKLDSENRPALKRQGFLTRDSRMKERRKFGLKKARKAPQFSKR